jgi:hypothetical protein
MRLKQDSPNNQAHSMPALRSRFVRERPHLHSGLLSLRNSAERMRTHPALVTGWFAAILLAMTAVVFAAHRVDSDQAHSWLILVERQSLWLMLLVGLQTATTVARRRKLVTARLRDSWLSATPFSISTRRSSLVVGVLGVPTLQIFILLGLLLLLHFAAKGEPSVLRHVVMSICGGFASGVLLGFVVSIKGSKNDRPGSRYIPGKKLHGRNTAVASLSALSRWPVASAFAWATPDTVRWPLMAAMLSVMSGSSAITGLTVVTFWMLILFVVTLCTATLRVTHQATYWLRVTPLSFNALAAALISRSLAYQVLASTFVALILCLAGLTVLQALVLAAVWIAFVLVAYCTTISYCYRTRSNVNTQRARISIALSAAAIGILEFIHRGTALPCAIFICLWQWRLGAKAHNHQGPSHANA